MEFQELITARRSIRASTRPFPSRIPSRSSRGGPAPEAGGPDDQLSFQPEGRICRFESFQLPQQAGCGLLCDSVLL